MIIVKSMVNNFKSRNGLHSCLNWWTLAIWQFMKSQFLNLKNGLRVKKISNYAIHIYHLFQIFLV